jgi:hypothetical protein
MRWSRWPLRPWGLRSGGWRCWWSASAWEVGGGRLSPWWRACTLSVQVEEAIPASPPACDNWLRWTK